MKTLLKLNETKLKLLVVLGFILMFLFSLSMQSCSMGRYRTTHGKSKHSHVKHTYTNNTDKSW
jgi:hypothetical protein